MLAWGSVPDDDAGTAETLRVMRGLVDQAVRDEDVVRLARRIVAPAARDPRGQARAIYDFVARHVRYVRDPVDYELVSSPLRLLREIATHGTTEEDCESMAGLIAALAESVGFRTRFHVVSQSRPADPGDHRFEHVWTDVQVRGEWVALDPALPAPAFGKRAYGESEAVWEGGQLMYVSRRALGAYHRGRLGELVSEPSSGWNIWGGVTDILKTGLEAYKTVKTFDIAEDQLALQQKAISAGLLPGATSSLLTTMPAGVASGVEPVSFVTNAYRTILGREPDASAQYYINMLRSGMMSPLQVQQALSAMRTSAVAPSPYAATTGTQISEQTLMLAGGALLLFMLLSRR